MKEKVKKNKNRVKSDFFYLTPKTHFIYFNSSIRRLNNLKIYKFLSNFIYI